MLSFILQEPQMHIKVFEKAYTLVKSGTVFTKTTFKILWIGILRRITSLLPIYGLFILALISKPLKTTRRHLNRVWNK